MNDGAKWSELLMSYLFCIIAVVYLGRGMFYSVAVLRFSETRFWERSYRYELRNPRKEGCISTSTEDITLQSK